MASGKKPKPQVARTCIFCGGTSLSKEHIWSDWLKKHVRQGYGHFFASAGYEYDKSMGGTAITSPNRQDARQGSAMQRKLRLVCVACNTGWMSRTVELAKPTILRMLRGETFSVSGSELEALASWVAITVVMESQQIPGEVRAIQPEDFAALLGGKPPRETWTMWAANYVGEDFRDFNHVSIPIYGVGRLTGEATIESPATDYMQITTIVIGQMVVHVFVATSDDVARNYRSEVMAFPVTLRIWPDPPATSTWPPPWGMLDPDVDGLTYGWLRRKMRFPGLAFPRQRFPDKLQRLFDSFIIECIPY